MPQETDAEKIARLETEIEQWKQEIERLRRALEEALRAGKRQAAPFSRHRPKANRQKPGRKPGSCYGLAAHRPVPDRVDETLEAELPAGCPPCGGGIRETGVVDQYPTEIPEPRVLHIRFRLQGGHGQDCGRRVQGRHPEQTSDAVGSAASQLGPRAVALATPLDKGLGRSQGKTAAVLEAVFGLRVWRGGLCQAFPRVAQKAEPTCQALIEVIRHSPSVTPDETGWKVGGRWWWLWTFASAQATVSSLQPGRGLEQAARRHSRCPANERFANHLWRNRNWVFTFLYFPGLEATHWRAQQALRPAVVARKVGGGNRTPNGAHTQEVLTSLLPTCRQQKRSWLALLVALLCSPLRQTWDLVASDLSPPHPC